jgi:AbrB family transcriptional regulator (stage V sporulation protein T)
MKATGIVRRIDDLGRVVIPKEIRRTLRIREGDPLEIYTDRDGEVIFKKYSMMGGLSDVAGQICETLHKTAGHPTVITDRDSIIALSGLPRREWLDKPVSAALESIMEERHLYRYRPDFAPIQVSDSHSGLYVSLAAPILSEGDVMGCVLFVDPDRAQTPGETERALLQTVAGFLGRHMEN